MRETQTANARVFPTDMRFQVSGFGGAYENACRRMLLRGADYLEAHPETPAIEPGEESAGEGFDAAIQADEPDVTGAMMRGVLIHLRWIQRHSWEQYVHDAKEIEAKTRVFRCAICGGVSHEDSLKSGIYECEGHTCGVRNGAAVSGQRSCGACRARM